MTDINNTFNEMIANAGFAPGLANAPKETPFHAFPQGGMARPIPMGITECSDGATALKLAGIDWQVGTVSVEELTGLKGSEGSFVSFIDEGSDNPYDNTYLGTNGKYHRVIQNTVLAELADCIIAVHPETTIVAGGATRRGKMTFLQLRLGTPLHLGQGEEVSRFITLYTSHDGGKVTAMASNFRLSCTNQWGALGRSSAKLASIAHTATAEQRTREAIFILQAAVTQFDKWDEALKELIQQPAELGAHIKNILGVKPDKEGRGLTLWEQTWDNIVKEYDQPFNSNIDGTGYAVLMAAQGVDEHYGKCGKGKRPEQQVTRLVNAKYPLATRAFRSLVTAR